MNIPTLEQLERALHIRGAIEALQAELSTVLNGLADAVAPEPDKNMDANAKGPFADSFDGARARRLRRKQENRPRRKSRAPRATATRRRRKSASRSRLWSILSGGEVGTAPIATEAKSHGRLSRNNSRTRLRKASVSKHRKRARKKALR